MVAKARFETAREYEPVQAVVHAQRDEYALLITLVLFWIFGYWGVAGPVLAALKVRAVMRLLDEAQARGRLREALQSAETQDVVIEMIARDNHIPRFLAARVFRLFVDRFRARPPG